MDFRSPQPVVNALEARAAHPVYGYGYISMSLCEAIAERMDRKHGRKVKPEWLCFTPGVVEYCLDDEARAVNDVAWAYERAVAQCRFDRDRVVLGGTSQGARIGIRTALAGDSTPARGFVAVVPALRDISPLEALMKGAASRGVRGYIIAGDQGPLL